MPLMPFCRRRGFGGASGSATSTSPFGSTIDRERMNSSPGREGRDPDHNPAGPHCTLRTWNHPLLLGSSARGARGAEMSDIGVAEIPVDEDERPLPPPEAPVKNALLDGPILRTLLWLAWPNVIALTAGTCVVIAETSYIGRLGVESLAAMALVFPCVILTMTMSGGAMGGGVASAIARALGAGDVERASTLAAHALLIGLCFGLTFMLGMLIFGPAARTARRPRQCAGAGDRLYADILRRRRGAVADEHDGRHPARHRQHEAAVADDAVVAICQIILGGTLGLGLGPIPQFGMRGVAAGSLTAYSSASP
jgi:hypothetical protein